MTDALRDKLLGAFASLGTIRRQYGEIGSRDVDVGKCNAVISQARAAISEALAALGRAPAAPVSAPGWISVPIEPTPEMIAAGRDQHVCACGLNDLADRDFREIWRASVTAAPLPEAQAKPSPDVHSAKSSGQFPDAADGGRE